MPNGVAAKARAVGMVVPHRPSTLPAHRSFVASAPIASAASAWDGIPIIVPAEPDTHGVVLFRRRNLLMCMALVLCACHCDRYWPMTRSENAAAIVTVTGLHAAVPAPSHGVRGHAMSFVSYETSVVPASTRRRELSSVGIPPSKIF